MLIPENDRNWVHQYYACLFVKGTDRDVSLHNMFTVLLISRQIFANVMQTADRVYATRYMVKTCWLITEITQEGVHKS